MVHIDRHMSILRLSSNLSRIKVKIKKILKILSSFKRNMQRWPVFFLRKIADLAKIHNLAGSSCSPPANQTYNLYTE